MSLNLEKYQEFATLVEQLRTDVTKSLLDAPVLKQRLAILQRFFVEQIVPLSVVDSREQSYQTEMSKQLRLLEVDVMFFQGARQSSTAQARMKTISDRLTTLIQYCQAILPQKAPDE